MHVIPDWYPKIDSITSREDGLDKLSESIIGGDRYVTEVLDEIALSDSVSDTVKTTASNMRKFLTACKKLRDGYTIMDEMIKVAMNCNSDLEDPYNKSVKEFIDLWMEQLG